MNRQILYLPNHNAFEITPVLENAVRIRYNASGIFKQTLMERYELVEVNRENVNFQKEELDDGWLITVGNLTITIHHNSEFSVCENGRLLFQKAIPFLPQDDVGVGAKFTLTHGERFYGGGYRPNRGIELRGQIIKNWCAPVTNNGPSPWIMSSNGWGLFWNHTGETFFDVACRNENELVAWAADGEMDFFIISGNFREMISSYTDITGKPTLMPLFGYGITTVNNEAETENTLFDKAERLRNEKIPCDTFSVSCEWMSEYYDRSVDQIFDEKRYFVKDWMTQKDQTFIGALDNKGIKVTLWTPCEYDLTYEQERRYFAKHPEAKKEALYTKAQRKVENQHLSIDANSRQFRDDNLVPTKRHDPYTVPEEAWAEHFKKFFDLGVIGIAEDGCAVEITKIDKCYGNGYTYKEMHNLNQSLNAYQYYHIYREYTGKRIFVRTPSTFVGHQRYCGTWCGDTTSDTSLIGMIQYSFQGESNVTADLISRNKEQIHAGIFMPWVLNFCWGHMMWPWMLEPKLRDIYVEYARLRYALMPYIYTEAYHTHKTGIPICTAMIINYPDDARFYDNYNQYMFGQSFLVGALTNKIDLPRGRWIDYWTGQEYDGGITIENRYPEEKGGYLFVKKGSIIPYWEDIMYVGEKAIDTMTIRIYPDEQGSYTLYEDDGISFAYEDGAYALTEVKYICADRKIKVTIENSYGEYEGKPINRTYHVEVVGEKPGCLPEGVWYNETTKSVNFTIVNSGSVEF